jgi:bacteriocin biosynthesis cyclodehydratase domain-containing protein
MDTHAESHLPNTVRLPKTVQLRPHHPLLRRATDCIQLGLGHDRGVEVSELRPPLLRMLSQLSARGRPLNEVLAEAVELGADESDAHALLVELYTVGALLDADMTRRFDAARRTMFVLVEGAGPLVAWVASGLASSGIGRLEVRTKGTVSADEVGVIPAAERGTPRIEAVPSAVRRIAPRARVSVAKTRGQPDLAVLTDLLRPSSKRHQELLAAGVPQLVVRLADGLGLVGPLVLPNRTACLRCLDLHRTARDPTWPTVSADLSSRVGSGSQATVRATAALAAEQALLALDSHVSAGEPPPTLDAVLELDVRRGQLRRRQWAPHPECGCGAAHIAPAWPDGGRTTSYSDAPRSPTRVETPPATCAATSGR